MGKSSAVSPTSHALVLNVRSTRCTPLNGSAAGKFKQAIPQHNKVESCLFILRERRNKPQRFPGCLTAPTRTVATWLPPSMYKMRVVAQQTVLPRSLTAPDKAAAELVLVATLVSIALCSYLLRLFTHGRRLRTFAFDDGLTMVAAASATVFIFWITRKETSLTGFSVVYYWVTRCVDSSAESWRRRWAGGRRGGGDWAMDINTEYVLYHGYRLYKTLCGVLPFASF